jgi:hypothetical protein
MLFPRVFISTSAALGESGSGSCAGANIFSFLAKSGGRRAAKGPARFVTSAPILEAQAQPRFVLVEQVLRVQENLRRNAARRICSRTSIPNGRVLRAAVRPGIFRA